MYLMLRLALNAGSMLVSDAPGQSTNAQSTKYKTQTYIKF